jgi:hypothetical protein
VGFINSKWVSNFLCGNCKFFGGFKNPKWINTFMCRNCKFFGCFINSKWVSNFLCGNCKIFVGFEIQNGLLFFCVGIEIFGGFKKFKMGYYFFVWEL